MDQIEKKKEINLIEGTIVKNISNQYTVKTLKGEYEALARGKFKNEEMVPVVGDKVKILVEDQEKKKAIIEEIKQRNVYIKRPRLANITQIVLVISSKDPKPDLLLLDKQLAFAEFLHIKAIIVLNKIDLDKKKEMEKIEEIYTKIGYNVIITRSKTEHWNNTA